MGAGEGREGMNGVGRGRGTAWIHLKNSLSRPSGAAPARLPPKTDLHRSCGVRRLAPNPPPRPPREAPASPARRGPEERAPGARFPRCPALTQLGGSAAHRWRQAHAGVSNVTHHTPPSAITPHICRRRRRHHHLRSIRRRESADSPFSTHAPGFSLQTSCNECFRRIHHYHHHNKRGTLTLSRHNAFRMYPASPTVTEHPWSPSTGRHRIPSITVYKSTSTEPSPPAHKYQNHSTRQHFKAPHSTPQHITRGHSTSKHSLFHGKNHRS